MSPEQWRDELPASEHPVIAMPGAPASFPTQLVRAHLQRRWVRHYKPFPVPRHPRSTLTTTAIFQQHYPLAAHLEWNTQWRAKGESTITQHLQRPFLAAHIRCACESSILRLPTSAPHAPTPSQHTLYTLPARCPPLRPSPTTISLSARASTGFGPVKMPRDAPTWRAHSVPTSARAGRASPR